MRCEPVHWSDPCLFASRRRLFFMERTTILGSEARQSKPQGQGSRRGKSPVSVSRPEVRKSVLADFLFPVTTELGRSNFTTKELKEYDNSLPAWSPAHRVVDVLNRLVLALRLGGQIASYSVDGKVVFVTRPLVRTRRNRNSGKPTRTSTQPEGHSVHRDRIMESHTLTKNVKDRAPRPESPHCPVRNWPSNRDRIGG
jgi:hypothetical protein